MTDGVVHMNGNRPVQVVAMETPDSRLHVYHVGFSISVRSGSNANENCSFQGNNYKKGSFASGFNNTMFLSFT